MLISLTLLCLSLFDYNEAKLPATDKEIKKLRKSWTSCEDFLSNSEFDAIRAIDVYWKIFYFWTPNMIESYTMSLRMPSPQLIFRYKELWRKCKGKYPQINWDAAEMFMESSVDISALFVRVNSTPGLYLFVASAPSDLVRDQCVVTLFGLKIVEPGYLGMLNCHKREGYALAPVDSMPKPEKIEAAAAKFGVKCDYRWSYLMMETTPMPPFHRAIDDQDDDFEVNMLGNDLNY